MIKKKIFTLLTISSLLFFSACELLDNPDKDGDFNISEDELNQLLDTLLIQGLEELGLGELGGILMDSVEYEKLPDTVIVIPDNPEPIDPNPEDDIPVSLFRQADLSAYFPSILSQGYQGSCTGWASSAIRSYYYNKTNDYQTGFNQGRFSPAYIYNQIRDSGCDDGAYTHLAAQFLVENGDVMESDFPYDDSQCSAQGALLKAEAAKYKLKEWKRIDLDIEQMKSWLDEKVPLLVSINVDDNFTYLNSSNDYYDENDYQGSSSGHAIVVSGYSDSINAFQLTNSWGQEWGTGGRAWVNYSVMMDILKEAFVVLQ